MSQIPHIFLLNVSIECDELLHFIQSEIPPREQVRQEVSHGVQKLFDTYSFCSHFPHIF